MPSRTSASIRPRLIALALAAVCACAGGEPGTVVTRSAADLDGALPDGWDTGGIVPVEGHAGWTRGIFSVTPDGASTYDLPLWAPPGRAGIAPDLSLHYSSRSGDSPIGRGWSLTGLSSITRCARSRSVDGDRVGPIRWDEDVFCLEGERLLPFDPPFDVPTACTGGTAEYLRPLHNSTDLVEVCGEQASAPTGFVVHHEDGTRFRYQQSVGGAACERDPSDPFAVRVSTLRPTYAWMLTRVEDLAGNFMVFHHSFVSHDEDTSPAPVATLADLGCTPIEIQTTEIRYTGHVTMPELGEGRRSVQLSYRRDNTVAPRLRIVGGAIACDESTVGCRADGTRPVSLPLVTSEYLSVVTALGPDGHVARTYAVNGGANGIRNVQECVRGTASGCREPLTFTYSQGQMADEGLAVAILPRVDGVGPNLAYTFAAHADFDGDGADELLVPDGERWSIRRLVTPSRGSPIFVTDSIDLASGAAAIPYDYDGDGRAELITSAVTTPRAALEVRRLGVPSGSEARRIYALGASLSSTVGCPEGHLRALPSEAHDRRQLSVGIGDPSGRGFGQPLLECVHATSTTSPNPLFHGRREVSWRTWPGRDTPSTYIDSISCFDSEALPNPFAPPEPWTIPFGTLSLDGSGRTSTLYVQWRGTCDEEAPDEGAVVVVPSGRVDDGEPLPTVNLEPTGEWVYLDANGDGLTDALDIRTPSEVTSVTWQLRLNMGGFFAPAVPALTLPADAAQQRYPGVHASNLRIADFDGNGTADIGVLIAGQNGDRMYVYFWDGSRYAPGRIGSVPGGIRQTPISGLMSVDSWPLTSVLDYDGDGLADLQYATPITGSDRVTLHVRHIVDQPAGLLIRVERSGVAQAQATYSRRHYSTGTCDAPSTPVICGTSVTTVATHSDHPLGSSQTGPAPVFQHEYSSPRFDVEGGGWLGFLRHRVLEPGASADEFRITDTYYQPPEFEVGYEPNTTEPHEGRRYLSAGRPRVSLRIVGRQRGVTHVRATFTEYEASVGPYPMAQIDAVHVREWRDIPSTRWSDVLPNEMPPGLDVGTFPSPPSAYLVRSIDRTFEYEPRGFAIPSAVHEVIPGIGRTDIALQSHMDARNWLLSQTDLASVTSATEGCNPSLDPQCQFTRTSSFEWGGYEGVGLNDNGFPHLLRRSVREPNGDPSLRRETTLGRDDLGGVTTTTLAASPDYTENPVQSTTLESDPDEHIFPRRITNSLGHSELIGFDPTLGVPLVVVDANDVETHSTYDELGRLRRSQGRGRWIDVQYRPLGIPSPNVRSGMVVVRRASWTGEQEIEIDQWDRVHNRRHMGWEHWIRSGVTYDALGRLDSVSRDAAEPRRGEPPPTVTLRRFTYDALDRITNVDLGDGGPPLRASYKGNTTTITDRLGHASVVIADMAGRPSFDIDTGEVNAPIAFTKYSYGPFGVVRSMRDHRGFSWTNSYDSYGRRTESHDPDAGDRAYVYDAFDRLSTELEASSGRVRSRYHFDELSRPTSIESMVDGEVRFEWDTAENGLGMLASAERVDDHVRNDYAYDAVGRLATEQTRIDDEVFAVDYAYDDGTEDVNGTGLLSSVTYPEVDGTRRRIDYVYDVERSRLPIAVNDGQTTLWTADAYDALGRVTEESFGDGTHTTYEYGERDHVPWLQHTDTTDAQGRTLADLSYEYDDAGNVTQRESGVGPPSQRSETYTYDRLSRLRTRRTRSQVDRFDYDDLGNLTNHAGVRQTYSADHPHQLATSSGTAVSYDERGRITDAPGLHVGSYTDFDMPRVLQSGTTTASFRFGPTGDRAVKQEQDSTTVYVHGLFERRTPRDSRLRTTTWNVSVAGRTIAQITARRARVTTSYLHADRNGSPVLVSSAGAASESYAYEPFGRRRRLDATGGVGSPSAPAEREGFTGAVQDGELGGLVYLGARMYSPSMGRFMSPDPIVGSLGRQGWNAYTYAANNPETLIDPTGMWPDDNTGSDGWSAFSAIGGFVSGILGSVLGTAAGEAATASSSPVAGPGGQPTTAPPSAAPAPTASAPPRPTTTTQIDSSGSASASPPPSIRDGISQARGRHQSLSDATYGLVEGAIPGGETGLEELDRWLHGTGGYAHLLHSHPTVSYEVARVVGGLTGLAFDAGAIIGGGGAEGAGLGMALLGGPETGGGLALAGAGVSAAGGELVFAGVAGTTYHGGVIGSGVSDLVDMATSSGTASPSSIRFTQDSIGRTFPRGGRTLRETIAGLRNGSISPSAFPPIRIFERNGLMFTLDNRRLFVFQQAGMSVRWVLASPAEVAREAWKFTTQSNGLSIRVRGGL